VLSHPSRNTVHLHDGDNLLHGHSKLIARVLTYEDDLPIGRKLNWLIALDRGVVDAGGLIVDGERAPFEQGQCQCLANALLANREPTSVSICSDGIRDVLASLQLFHVFSLR